MRQPNEVTKISRHMKHTMAHLDIKISLTCEVRVHKACLIISSTILLYLKLPKINFSDPT